MSLPTIRAATCHISPILLSSKLTTQKVITYIHKAASNSAQLITFPESYIPGFPIWSAILAPSQAHHFFQRFAQESLYIDGEELNSVRYAARQTRTTVSLGFSEKVRYSTATLFNSNVIIGSDGEVQVHHRKLVPTFFEKLSWGPGDGFGLRTADIGNGVRVGTLICGENTNPLARYALMSQGQHVHVSTWPAAWPTRLPISPQTDPEIQVEVESAMPEIEKSRKKKAAVPRNYDNVLANRTRAAAHCFEAKCFGILSAAHMSQDNINILVSMVESAGVKELVKSTLGRASLAPSMFLDPTGAPLPGFEIPDSSENTSNGTSAQQGGSQDTKDMLRNEEGILYADLDLNECIEGKQYHDLVGGYQRFDVFNLQVNRERRWAPAIFNDGRSVTPNISKSTVNSKSISEAG